MGARVRAEEGEFFRCGEVEAWGEEVVAEEAEGEPEKVLPLDGEAPGVAVAARADPVGTTPDAVPNGEAVAVKEAPAEAVARGLAVEAPDADPLPLDVPTEEAEGGAEREPRALPLPLGEALPRVEPEGAIPEGVVFAESVAQAVLEGERLLENDGRGEAEGVFAPLLEADADAEGEAAADSVALAHAESTGDAEPPRAVRDATLLRVAAAGERESAGEGEFSAVEEGEAEMEGVPPGEVDAEGLPDAAAVLVGKVVGEGGAEAVAVSESPAPPDGVADAAVPAGEGVAEREAGIPV